MMVKICGITTAEDARAAVEAGASALGFNFWSGSPRYIRPERAAEIMRLLPEGVLRVGVFVNESAAAIEEIARSAPLDIAQLHGRCGNPRGLRLWKAVAAGSEQASADGIEAWLIDTPAGDRHGGTGQTFDWALASGLQGRIILAGGLDAENVRAAIARARPWGVDACSRLESAPGKKDLAKMRAFLSAALEDVRA